jgi:serine/threonine protein kinase
LSPLETLAAVVLIAILALAIMMAVLVWKTLGPNADPELRGFIGGFRIRRRIARGGMSEIYLASTRDGSPVVLKILGKEWCADLEAKRRFLAEDGILRALDDGSGGTPIVRSLAAGEDAATRRPYIALEHLPGETLAKRLDRGAVPETNAVHEVASAVLEALRITHAKGYCHGDVSPANVILAKSGATRGPWAATLIDFGVAILQQEDHASGGATWGKPSYMAPEHGTDGRVSASSDMYSYGVLLYELVFGRLPFTSSRNDLTETLELHRTASPEYPKGTDPRLSSLLDSLLAKDPAARLSAEQTRVSLDRIWPKTAPDAARAGRASSPAPSAGFKPAHAASIAFIALVLFLGALAVFSNAGSPKPTSTSSFDPSNPVPTSSAASVPTSDAPSRLSSPVAPEAGQKAVRYKWVKKCPRCGFTTDDLQVNYCPDCKQPTLLKLVKVPVTDSR